MTNPEACVKNRRHHLLAVEVLVVELLSLHLKLPSLQRLSPCCQATSDCTSAVEGKGCFYRDARLKLSGRRAINLLLSKATTTGAAWPCRSATNVNTWFKRSVEPQTHYCVSSD